MREIIRRPSALIPIMMSITAFLLLITQLALFGIQQPHNTADEGLSAHLFQILLSGQIPIVAYFVFRWFPKRPKEVLLIIIMQIFIALIPYSIVYLLEL